MTKKKIALLSILAILLIGLRLAIFDPAIWQHVPLARGFSLGSVIASYQTTIKGSSRKQILAIFGKPDEGTLQDQTWIYKMPTITMGQGALAIEFDNSNVTARVSSFRVHDSY